MTPIEYTQDEPCITPEQAMGWPARAIWIAAGAVLVAVVGALVVANWPLFLYAASSISTAH